MVEILQWESGLATYNIMIVGDLQFSNHGYLIVALAACDRNIDSAESALIINESLPTVYQRNFIY